ncbi:hypothetical protein Bca4012_102263 [Brassica carinata]|uniref:(rape) hypothetical protein n=1 Tax=Brassica napus TaxID=3708 RepID=A0A816QU08_BRANA|nr:unnamed protein product [Brassica napus]
MTATSKDTVLSFRSRLSNQKRKEIEIGREGGRVSYTGYGISATHLLLSLFQLLSLISRFVETYTLSDCMQNLFCNYLARFSYGFFYLGPAGL